MGVRVRWSGERGLDLLQKNYTTMGRGKIAFILAILLASTFAMELQHAASAGRQFSPDPLTNALGIGFMTVAMIDGIHKIQGVLEAIEPNIHPIGLSLTESTTASSG